MENRNIPFEIIFNDKVYLVSQQSDGNFAIKEGTIDLTKVYLEPGNLCLEWRSTEQLDANWVNGVGRAIYEHNMGDCIL